ncbi:MAG: hypothetical protein LLG14_16635 [Nocardiaceae bacterium]|nr:hypothetical protein [Nocardiaceae bacterium]
MAMTTHNVDDNGVGLQGYSPVSYVDHGKAEPGLAVHSAQYNGVTYHFTDADQVAAFQANPAKYEPAYGGWCAFGLTIDKQFDCDPSNFKVVHGRLMGFLRNDEVDALALWRDGDEAELVAKADATWASLRRAGETIR